MKLTDARRLFNQKIVPITSGVDQRREMNNSFVCGAASMFEVIIEITSPPDAQAERGIQALHKELLAMQADIVAAQYKAVGREPPVTP